MLIISQLPVAWPEEFICESTSGDSICNRLWHTASLIRL